MWLSMLSVWGGLLTLVASQSCSDPSENRASRVTLKPLGQCKDGESTCPYRITLPPLTIQLPKSFRELENMARELRSLTQMVNQLKEDCRMCKERQEMEVNIWTVDEGEDGERIQASRGTVNTRERQQEIPERESTVQGTISRSAVEDTMNNTEASNSSQEKTSFSGDLDSEQPTQHEKHKASTITTGHEMDPIGTLTAEGKVKSVPENDMVTNVTEDYDVGYKVRGERLLVTGTDAQNKTEPNMKQEDKKKVEKNTGETNSNISDDNNSGNVAKEVSVGVIQQPTLNNKEKKEKKNHGASSTKPKPLKPGASVPEANSEVKSRPVNTADTIRGHKKVTSPVTGRDNISFNVSQMNPQTLEIKSKNAFKPDTDAKMDTGIESKQYHIAMSHSHTSGIPDGVVDVSQTNPQILDSRKQLNIGTDSESDAGMNSNPVINIDTVSGVNSRSPISDSVNATADADVIHPKIKKSNTQTSLKPSRNEENHTGMDSNPVNKIETGSGATTSRSPTSGITDGIVDVSQTTPQILDSKKQLNAGTDSESDAGMNSKPLNNVDTVSGVNNSSSFITDRASSEAEADPINPQSLNSQNPFTRGIDIKSNPGNHSHPFNTSETVSRLRMPNSPISDITDAVEVNQTYPGILDGTFKRPFIPGTDKKRKVEMDSNALSKVDKVSPLEVPRLSVTGGADATVNVDQINPQTTYTNSEKTFNPETDSESQATTPVNKFKTFSQVETSGSPISGRSRSMDYQINPQAMDHISKNQLKPDTISERKARIYPKQDHETVTVTQIETSESPISNSRLDVNFTNPSLDSNYDPPKKQFLPKSKLNMTQPRNGRINSSNPINIDTERKKTLSNNKTIPLRRGAMTSGRSQPMGILPRGIEKQQAITNQKRNGPIRSKDPIDRKPDNLRENPIHESKSFGSGGPKNTTGVTDYAMNNGTTHDDSKNVSSPNNEFNTTVYDMTQSVMPMLATQGILDQAHIKTAKTDLQIESTSQTTVTEPRLDGISGQDLGLDTVNNIGRDSQPPVVEETRGTASRKRTTPLRTSSVDSHLENRKKPPRVGSIQNLVGKRPLAVVSSERNELKYPTTAATPYTIQTESKNKHNKMPQFTPPITTAPHFMGQGHAEQVKSIPRVKASNKHVRHRLDNPSQEMESKRSHSNTGNKELQSASKGQVSGMVTDLQPNSLDSIQNRATGPTAVVMDVVKASTGAKVSTTSTESTGAREMNPESAREMNPVVTEANRLIPSLTPFKSVAGKNEGLLIDNNNGNSYPVALNRMTGAKLQKIPAAHNDNEDNKKPLTVNNVDDRQGLEKQLLSKCHGQCDLDPTPRSIPNSRFSSNNNRDKPSQDCSDFMMRNPTSGIYNVTPTGSKNRTFPVFCDMKSSGGGWTLIQRRFDGSISFNRTWNDYKKGFGNLTGEFWLGNDKIHWLTATKVMALRIELEDLDGVKEYAQYDLFHVANESQYYRLTIEGYSGTAGDAMQYDKKFNHNHKNFTTPDRDNDQYTSGNCGDYYGSGWWFDACMSANLNGKYYETRYRGVRNGIFWGTWHNISTESYLTLNRQSFKTVRMMIRPKTGLRMD